MSGRNKKTTDAGNIAGAISKVFTWLMIGWIFKDFLFGRVIIYAILGSILLIILLAHTKEKKQPNTYKSRKDHSLLRKNTQQPVRTVPLPPVRMDDVLKVVRIVPMYDHREKKDPEKAHKKTKELVLMEVCCKNCGASELKKETYGLYSCVYCGTTYRSREYR